MRVSARGVAEIAAHEGVVQMPYRDSVGVWTFGIGHTRSAGAPDPAKMARGEARPMSEVLQIFRRDLKRFEERVDEAVTVRLEQHEFDSLCSFDFNTGGIHRAKLTGLLNDGKRAEAADAFMGWSKPKEIIPRRQAEMKLFRTGTYASDGTANVYPANTQGQVQWSRGKRLNVLELLGEPPKRASQPADKPRAATYTVKRGDVLSVIAARHDVTVAELVAENGIARPDRIQVGQVLRIPGGRDSPDQASEPSEPDQSSTLLAVLRRLFRRLFG